MPPPGDAADEPAAPPTLTVAITAFDEAVRLPPSLERAFAYLEARGEPYEIVINDDGSRDTTV